VNTQKATLTVFVVLVALTTACTEPDNQNPTPTITPTPTATSVGSSDSSPALAPVFSVSNIDGENVRLEDLLGSVPVYLVFVPSTTDDPDVNQLENIQSKLEQFEEMDAEVVVVVSELPTAVIDTRDALALEFSLIADPLNVVANDWQVFDLNNDGKSSPASFVFDAHGNLIARLVASAPDDRPSVDEVLSVIEESLSIGAA
jgi:peroxiredoxin